MKVKSLVAGVILACAHASPSLAYNYINYCGATPVRWSGVSKTFSAAALNFPNGSAYHNALQTVFARVTDPINFNLNFTNNDLNVALGNGESEVWFSADAAHSPAVAYNYTTCAGGAMITESDVVFYLLEPYTTSMNLGGLWGYGGNSRPFQTTAVHEFGHAINLGHVNTEYNIMGQDYFHLHANAGLARSYLGEDAADGAIALYGSNGHEDLSLVHWKRTGAFGQYSSHGRTKLYSSGGVELPSVLVSGESRFDVSAGQTINVELTAENNGASPQNVKIGFYLSTNNAIATSDTLITTQARIVARDDVDTYQATITLPYGHASGDYWLGAIIDRNNAVNESAEDNNATYFPVRYTAGTPPALPECADSDTRALGQNCQRSNRASQNYDYMYIYIPPGVSQLKIMTLGGTGNTNLYYNGVIWATTSNYQYASTNAGNIETITVPDPPSGYVYISLHAASPFTGVTVRTEY